MSNSPYKQLDRLIDEYEEYTKIIRGDKLIMMNYPKLFVMSVASLFEKQIKHKCKNFVDFPLLPISSTYPTLQTLINEDNSMPITDKMFTKLRAKTLNAEKFYSLFGGLSFKQSVELNFSIMHSQRITIFEDKINALLPLIGQDDKYDRDYAEFSDIKERLTCCTFSTAEKAYLSLKSKRNRLAHDFINGLSDSFNDVRYFYLDAILYVLALETAIESLTDTALLTPVT